MRKSALLLAAAALMAAAPAADAQGAVTCESFDGRQRLCRVDTRGGVRLARQLSESPCRQGRSWGVTREGIWVTRGCRAQFYVGRDDGYDRDRNDGRYDGRYDRDRGSFTNARSICQRAVASRLRTSTRNVSTWLENRSQNNVRVGWRAGRRESGSCRIDRRGEVRVRFDRDDDRRRW